MTPEPPELLLPAAAVAVLLERAVVATAAGTLPALLGPGLLG